MKPNAMYMEQLLTMALNYIYEQNGTINDFLDDNYSWEEFYELEYNEYFGFNESGEKE